MEDDSSYELTIYKFDSSTVESGFVEISEKRTLLYFPPLQQTLSSLPRELNIYLNNTLIFSFKWLPFFSAIDNYRIRDMFLKGLSFVGQYYTPPPPTSPNQTFHKHVTNIKIKNFTIYTLEEPPFITSIQITHLPVSPLPDLPPPDHIFQIMIGPSTNICSERDLPGLNQDESLYIIGYILHKITDI